MQTVESELEEAALSEVEAAAKNLPTSRAQFIEHAARKAVHETSRKRYDTKVER